MDEKRGYDLLHAPWRMDYVGKTDMPKDGCVFCEKARDHRDRENLVVYRGERCYVILNIFPYNIGHLMVIPYQHTSDLCDLPVETYTEMLQLTALTIAAMKRSMHPDGFNLGMNLGRIAGAGIAEHLHMHVVPRWAGDTNFVTVIGQTRVLPEALERTWEKLCKAFDELACEQK